ncbi:MAG: acetyl-CoA carboxylase biotin carboxyl carrier protein subunit [Treponema sp.]|nr:acetyl-CoA carboxylase biotin carboxyl carrier protein subunit [Treponema sp.]
MIEKFNTGEIGELELNDGTSRLVLKKTSIPAPCSRRRTERFSPVSGQASGAAQGAAQAPGGNAVPAGTSGVTPGADTSGAGVTPGADTITSPIVGTFYPALSPDAPPLVRPGSKVKTGDTLCILEAMKMMNHLVAEFDCEILAVKAASGDMVEYGQALFEVKRL